MAGSSQLIGVDSTAVLTFTKEILTTAGKLAENITVKLSKKESELRF